MFSINLYMVKDLFSLNVLNMYMLAVARYKYILPSSHDILFGLILRWEEPPKDAVLKFFQGSIQSASKVGEMDSWIEGHWV
jgi:hypothetical protein